jgi:hypothetical protein
MLARVSQARMLTSGPPLGRSQPELIEDGVIVCCIDRTAMRVRRVDHVEEDIAKLARRLHDHPRRGLLHPIRVVRESRNPGGDMDGAVLLPTASAAAFALRLPRRVP